MAVVSTKKIVRRPRRTEAAKIRIKVKQIRYALDILKEQIETLFISCRQNGSWISIEVCYITCNYTCHDFHSIRWLCESKGRCANIEKCEEKSKWCKPLKSKKEKVEKYLELYVKWREMKKLMKEKNSE